MNSPRKPWSRDELIIAMNLYCQLPFGKLDAKTPIIIDVAARLERTPGSVAMKLRNLVSLDPVQQARGIKGLSGTSKSDRAIWEEFSANWEVMGSESEERFQALFKDELVLDITQEPSETESVRASKIRIGQDFFRKAVLAAYGGKCCITQTPVPELLVASHIIPWSKATEHRLNPSNGLCLNSIHDAAFDRGLISFDDNYQLILSKYIKDFLPENTLEDNFVRFSGQTLTLPDRFLPKIEFIQYHRKEVFRGI
jgi:putative restriction endonuclease